MKMKLELVSIPVTDVDRAKAFYAEQVGFRLDHDVRPAETVRIVQLTPLESACSIVIATGLPGLDMPPGSQRGLHLVIGNMAQTREELLGRGVVVSEIEEYDQGIKTASFSDPDGNTWVLQELPWRSPEF